MVYNATHQYSLVAACCHTRLTIWKYDFIIESMNALSIKLPAPMLDRITQRANDMGSSTSEVVRAAIAAYLQADEVPALSAAAQAARWAGSVKGAKDLSTNAKHMDGYGR
jgi:Arc/MetJ-type ribon-helix-helix transcriptional regulator